jgi:hypothetical protein
MTHKERKALEHEAKANCKKFSRRHGGADGHTCIDLKRPFEEMCRPCSARWLLMTEGRR